MLKNIKTVLAVALLAGGLLASSAIYAHESGDSQSPKMGQGGMMGPGMMGPGMMGGGMMGMMNMMGRGMKGHGFGGRVVSTKDLTVDDVRHFLDHRLAKRGNKRLKLGEVKEQGEDAIIADIVTLDDSLVERLKVDRHTGGIENVE